MRRPLVFVAAAMTLAAACGGRASGVSAVGDAGPSDAPGADGTADTGGDGSGAAAADAGADADATDIFAHDAAIDVAVGPPDSSACPVAPPANGSSCPALAYVCSYDESTCPTNCLCESTGWLCATVGGCG